MFVTQRQPFDPKATKKPCKFCQRSRWLMTITILVMLFSVVVLNQP